MTPKKTEEKTATVSSCFADRPRKEEIINMKIMPSTIRTKEGMRKLLSLIKTYFDRGGWHVQFNMIDPTVLLDAKKHPEKHRELVVRVAGYSAYFVELTTKVQDEIIARTLHSV